MKTKFTQRYADQVHSQLASGKDVREVKVDISLSRIKPTSANCFFLHTIAFDTHQTLFVIDFLRLYCGCNSYTVLPAKTPKNAILFLCYSA